MRVRGRREIRLQSININCGFPVPVQSSVQASPLREIQTLVLSSKNKNNTILGKSSEQSLKDAYAEISFTEIWSFLVNGSKRFNWVIGWVFWSTEVSSLKNTHQSDLFCFHNIFPWCTCVITRLLSPSSCHFGRQSSKVPLWKAAGKPPRAAASAAVSVRRSAAEGRGNSAVLSLDLAAWEKGCSKKLLCCTVSFRLAVKDATVLPAVTAAGQS